MAIYRVFGDDAGETHLTRIELPVVELPGATLGVSRAAVLNDIPSIRMGIFELLDRTPDLDLHPPPQRQFLVILRGAYEITTSAGDQDTLWAGDCILVDDFQSKGHKSRDVGEEPFAFAVIPVPDDWEFPISQSS